MIYARIRSDLRGVYRLAKQSGEWVDVDEWVPCMQPDELDNEEFNTIILDSEGNRLYALASIDLEFKEVTV